MGNPFVEPEEIHRGTPGFMQAFECSGRPIAFVDMDGTGWDYFSARAASGLDYSVFNATPGAFRNLQLFPDTRSALEILELIGYDVYFLSRPAVSAPMCLVEKLESVLEHFPDKIEKVIFANNKGIIGRSRDVIIDDHLKWSNGDCFPGLIVHHTSWKDSIQQILVAHRDGKLPPEIDPHKAADQLSNFYARWMESQVTLRD